MDQYSKISNKYAYDAIVVYAKEATFVRDILDDQSANSKRLNWVHSLTHGVDNYLRAQHFAEATNFEFTKASGLASRSLSEFIALGMLWHSKKLPNFMQQQANKQWIPEEVDSLQNKTMTVLGFGSIGSACGQVAKNGFGMRVMGVDLYPSEDPEIRACATELIGLDQLPKVIPATDYFVGVLPHTKNTANFINMETVFSKLKPSSIFMSIGRGTTVNE